MIEWIRDKRKFTNGWIGCRVKSNFKFFYIGWESDYSNNGENYYLKCYLPGFKENAGNYKNKDAAIEAANFWLTSWLTKMNFTIKRIK